MWKGNSVTLTQCATGDIVEVVSVTGAGDSGPARRLTDLGFLPGTRVQVLRRAPMGDPTVYALRDYQMCLRRSESDRIVVSSVPAHSTESA